MGKIKIDSLEKEVVKALDEYKNISTEKLKKAIKEVADESKKEISSNAPKRIGKYSRSFAVKKDRDTSNSISLIIHSKDRYQLTHLLEFGHAKRGGGRVRAYPHIGPAEEKLDKRLDSKIKEAFDG